MSYRLLTFRCATGEPRAGLLVDNQVHDISELGGDQRFASVLEILQHWSDLHPILQNLASDLTGAAAMPLTDLELLAPILYPTTVYCAGANYADHVRNMEQKLGLPASPDPRADGGKPYHFLKSSRCCVGPGATVRAPSPRLDWEGELVAVVGRAGRDIPVERVGDHIAGYMVGNDLSARDIAFKPNYPPPSIFHHSFFEHKSFEHAAPIGPWFTPASAVSNPDDLVIRTKVNGTAKQAGSCRGMIFSTAEQIAYLSTITTLFPGDIIMTGTPAGVGAETGEFLAPGDVVEVAIDGLGSLTTYII